MTRREMMAATAALVPAAMAAGRTRMTIHLDCGSIGVKANQTEALTYAARFGFESITADSGWLAAQDESTVKRFLDEMKAKNIVWANAGLPVEFRKTDEEFAKGLKELPARSAALRKAGVTRVSTWLSPNSDVLTYRENFDLHARRLRECARILKSDGLRLGLEYVGPKTLWTARRYAFVHTMKEMKELIAGIGEPNVGFLMDSWHWYTAGDTVPDILSLANKDVISVDLNDAPAGVSVDQQIDSKREVPCATGVIAVADFLNALNKIGCDAPVRCEPFNAALRAMPPDEALKTTVTAMKKAFALIV
ncbi:TIM barrel protein [uncultured Paludibaculum sp.]|uniref:sugar phosphate isomerase/epimerase family protein n=1 Tax=uncultured Paludibaculum sp. TaxID=1765020 RepID=UPI002AAAF3F9|nr:TIM barrel protein [uncultured Paludibaculum sp.]